MNPEDYHTLRWLAERVQSGNPVELWDRHVQIVKDAWRNDRTRQIAQGVVDKYPEKFPDFTPKG